MFTDMVGYSALTQRDEALALDLLREHHDLLRDILLMFEGREIKSTGDGLLVEFSSALAAVQCAVEIQRTLAERNEKQSEERQIQIRIGIHLGDVVKRGDDVLGDGVNIAARIEPLAEAGGICVTRAVFEQIQNKVPQPCVQLSKPELKNISASVEVYKLVLDASPADLSAAASGRRQLFWVVLGVVVLNVILFLKFGTSRKPTTSAAPPAANGPRPPASASPEEKSIAVLPFANMSDETNNAFFADGIHEDILTTLAHVRDLKVVSRTSVAQYRATTKTMRQIAQELGVAYVLEGSVRRAGGKVRVTGQLIRAATDDHVWAKSYDRDLTDIFAIQSALATEIAGALRAVISPREKSLIERQPTDNLAAYDLYLKGRGGVKGTQPEITRLEAERALAEAVKLDPDFAVAWGYLAEAHALAVFQYTDNSSERLANAKMAIETAVRLAPDDPDVIELLGNYYYYGFRDYARAAEQYQRLLVIEPHSANAYTQIGYVHRRQGHWSEALANFRHALEFDPLNVDPIMGLSETLVALRQYDEGTAQFRRAVEISRSEYFFSEVYLNPSWLPFFARGSTREGDAWLAGLKSSPAEETKLLFARRNWARVRGDWALAVAIDEQQPHLDPYDDPHWAQDADAVWDLVGNNELTAARARAERLAPELKTLCEQQPANANIWRSRALLHAFLGDKEAALRCGRKAVELLPESKDALDGPRTSEALAKVHAWTGDKEAALTELERLLRTPFGANVFSAHVELGWLPLRGDARFDALLNDPKNNLPMR